MKKRFSIFLTAVIIISTFLSIQVNAASIVTTLPTNLSEQLACHPGGTSEHKKKGYFLKARVLTIKGEKYLKLTTNLKLTDKNYGGAPVAGAGHVHYYLDDQITGPITNKNLFKLTNLHEGTNKIRLVLAQNNHMEDFGAKAIVELTVVK
ncbi:hypothetical protein [Paenibacillus sp. L3-i20]|uniref:hypothetical protein n=1 Tax=Paenibacillus sp. L3-i20 TaxID=2905833 RepID=UPI001EDF553D|nr:hypothetical protein [Paenibacillus sp. L3-i20]GKU78891.1 hypothetical protein L3i20_v232880 [Paenibacillus sp. L3-i20]